eukprot:358495-Chlamydomonas_euryale.AAC.2
MGKSRLGWGCSGAGLGWRGMGVGRVAAPHANMENAVSVTAGELCMQVLSGLATRAMQPGWLAGWLDATAGAAWTVLLVQGAPTLTAARPVQAGMPVYVTLVAVPLVHSWRARASSRCAVAPWSSLLSVRLLLTTALELTKAPSTAPSTAPAIAPATARAMAPETAPATAPAMAPATARAMAPETALETAPAMAPAMAQAMAPETAPAMAPAMAPVMAPAMAPAKAPETTAPAMAMGMGVAMGKPHATSP